MIVYRRFQVLVLCLIKIRQYNKFPHADTGKIGERGREETSLNSTFQCIYPTITTIKKGFHFTETLADSICAQDWNRTSTPVKAADFESAASTNSATWAKTGGNITT